MSFLNDLSKMKNAKTRLFSPENVYGEKGKGGMADITPKPQPEVEKIGQVWTGINPSARELGQKWKVRPYILLESGVETTILDTGGPGRITHMWMTVFERWLREIVIRIYWDNEETPSVCSPLGDFFLSGWGKALEACAMPIGTYPRGGMNSYFPMPFRKHAKITLENLAPQRSSYFYYAITMEETPVADDEAYFHAEFKRVNPLGHLEDYVILDNVKGRGQFVGTQISWQQNSDGWWGEGEFKAFIDGDKEFPTYCHTGAEDYFCGAWGFGAKNFSSNFAGYQNLSLAEGRAPYSVGDRHSMYRFHVLDPIRFETDFKAVIQAIGWRQEHRYWHLRDDIASVAYWYQTEPHVPFKKIYTRDELEIVTGAHRDDMQFEFDPFKEA